METMLPQTIESSVAPESECAPEKGKVYESPKLIHYGDIASLVKLVVVNAADGGAAPFEAPS